MKKRYLLSVIFFLTPYLYSQNNDLYDVNYDYIEKEIIYDEKNDIFQKQFMQYEKNISIIENDIRLKEEQKKNKLLSTQKTDYEALIANLKNEYESQISSLKESNLAEIQQLKTSYEKELSDTVNSHAEQISQFKNQISILKESNLTEIQQLKTSHEKELSDTVKSHAEQISQFKNQISDLQNKNAEDAKTINSCNERIIRINAELEGQKQKNAQLEKTISEQVDIRTEASIEQLTQKLTAEITSDLSTKFEERYKIELDEIKNQLEVDFENRVMQEVELLKPELKKTIAENNNSTTTRIKYLSFVLAALFVVTFIYFSLIKLFEFLNKKRQEKQESITQENNKALLMQDKQKQIEHWVSIYLEKLNQFKSNSFFEKEAATISDEEEKSIRRDAFDKAYHLYNLRKTFETPDKIRKTLEEYYPKELFGRWNQAGTREYFEGLINSFYENKKKYAEKFSEIYNTIELRDDGEKVLIENIIEEKTKTLQDIAKQIENLNDFKDSDIRKKLNDLVSEYRELFNTYVEIGEKK